MRIGFRHFTRETVVWLTNVLTEGTGTRSSIGKELCEREDWRNEGGDLCLASARLTLPAMARRLQLDLPSAGSRGRLTAALRSP